MKLDYEELATAIAESITPHLDKPTTPIINYHLDGDYIIVVMADGRKCAATVEIAKDLLAKKLAAARPIKIEAPRLMALPAHKDNALPPANLKPNGKRKPASVPRTSGATHKAGKP